MLSRARRWFVWVLASVALTASAQAAMAAPITFTYTGLRISRMNYEPSGGSLSALQEFAVGDPATFSITFESTTPDALPSDPAQGLYTDAIVSLTVTLGSYTLGGDVSSVPTYARRLTVEDDAFGKDRFGASVTTTGYFPIGATVHDPSGAPLLPRTARLDLRDSTATVFSSDSLPTTRPDPESFTNLIGSIDFVSPAEGAGVQVHLEFVPEPSTALLLGVGVTGLALRRRRAV